MKEVREWVRQRERRERDRSGWERPSVAMETGSYQLTLCFPLFPHPPPHSLPFLFPALPLEHLVFPSTTPPSPLPTPPPPLPLATLALCIHHTLSSLAGFISTHSFCFILFQFFLPVLTAAHVKPQKKKPHCELTLLTHTGRTNTPRHESELHLNSRNFHARHVTDAV